jgi:pyrimidine-specific ribonucleoside hydrolase
MRKDVAGQVEAIVTRHGLEAWKACLLTNELHRHLGIYSLIGAKMGVRARELLDAPFDTLEVVSYAGLKPPLSCMNDGLQVSTGASLGRGAIQVVEGLGEPRVRFIRNGVTAELTLKPEFLKRIRSDIAGAMERFGSVGPEYFDHIRQLSVD